MNIISVAAAILTLLHLQFAAYGYRLSQRLTGEDAMVMLRNTDLGRYFAHRISQELAVVRPDEIRQDGHGELIVCASVHLIRVRKVVFPELRQIFRSVAETAGRTRLTVRFWIHPKNLRSLYSSTSRFPCTPQDSNCCTNNREDGRISQNRFRRKKSWT